MARSRKWESRVERKRTKIYSAKQVAHHFGVHINTVYQWLNSRELKSYRYGTHGHLRIKEEWLHEFEEAWLKSKEDCGDLLERRRERKKA
jgi:excisionase family DNA binding protein